MFFVEITLHSLTTFDHASRKKYLRCLARRNVNPKEPPIHYGPEGPNAPVVQPPQGDVTNATLWNAIYMLTQVVT
uniref:Uncharacterized protein n=1 Tax=Solanum tuberosum TaxID=4113 RepID=M1DD10_SOLTU